MARYTGPKNRLSRREGVDLFGKGNKLRRATQPPGQHGAKGSRRRPTSYGTQLREKQKIRRIYGIMERQFRGYFEKARKVRGKTGEVLLRLLETRLDNIVYRLGFAPSRSMARQLVSHGHVVVDGAVVNIPSFQVRAGQTITLQKVAMEIPHVKERLGNLDYLPPAWLKRQAAAGHVTRFPDRSEIDSPVNEQLIVEFYSR
ncbi:30S ribosomal protein S4 [Candidatus Amesbacteria bacterium RIFCSPLOWO2_02_FULL_48_11]|uniref:Small ribosomal subunit protein uS4 n=5 Tax=Candidatus Amesiibacteriota TaxID=1752730 RepID=A0A1F4ZCY6_9BACT|nr:MAG: 30S ribosomal protein S4 A [Candidatus Amesbacteria bacterium GW2011_GWA2_47_11]KKU94575.1 MAG: 30S ribosomal protein S4 A [Candidatus Amesbacteria bacterium GW2011_GWC1_48_10]KKW00361.1 MAG: 30S ribosomal protein S4 A [Candidatus Amesbacteria bacterium GW2011_GWA1_48_9]OGC89664.1 MAG: 30S ribosomal protein S4 [Candidatus Amesbacteria bacterium RBG_19FT_COMBO_48_16]OGC96801.1 MAG: 30S ribosomal protein S4 [Candidatus Amesbacteria bacterium RBG_16_48_31]OGC96935.1 MAG: 30S ribosomal pro